MATTGNVFAGTGENNAGIGATAWTTPENVVSDNATDATCNAPASSQYLVARTFDFSSIPNDAIITGITVRAEASEHSAGTESLNAQLQDESGALFGSSQAQTISGTPKAVYTYGGTTDVWGATLTPAIVKDADFGVRLWFTTAHDVRVDYVTMAVEYQLPPTPSTKTAAPQQTVAREVAGFAVAFIAAAAHIPEPASADAIGAAQYTSGTHQAALEQSQPKPWVRGTPSALIPGPAADSPLTRIVITIPQRDGERAPQVWHALIPEPGTDTIGSAYYSVGTHQASVASRQPQPSVIRTPAGLIPPPAENPATRIVQAGPQPISHRAPHVARALIPSDTPIGRLLAVPPQQVPDLQPRLSKALIPEPVIGTDTIGAASYTVGTHRPRQVQPAIFRALIPAAEDRIFTRGYEADQQIPPQPQPYFARAKIDALPVDVSYTKQIIAAPQQVPSGSASVTRARIDDTLLSKTMLARGSALQQPQPVFAKAQIEPLPVHEPNARTLYAHQQVLEHQPARIFGRLVVESVVADTPEIRFISTAPQGEDRTGSQVWRAQIAEAAVSARFVLVPPQDAVDGRGWIKSPATQYQVLGTDTAVGVFRFADQRFVPIQYGVTSRISISWQLAGGTVTAYESGWDDVYFEPITFDDVRFDVKDER